MRAEAYIRDGFFREGFELYEARWEVPDYPDKGCPVRAPRWQGEDLAGRRILLWHEQGLGDVIQMLRFVPVLVRQQGRVVLAVQRELKRLAESVAGLEQVITYGDTFDDVDCQCPLLSLPYRLGVRLANLPNAVPYLWPPQELIDAWRSRLGPLTAMRVGLVCSGSGLARLAERSIQVAALAPLLDLPCEFHLLQDRIGDADRAFLAGVNVHMHDDELTDMAETAALTRNLDLIISIDSAVAHLAGALGLPCWVMLPRQSDMRWMIGRSDSPWYPSLRLFRQTTPDDWGPVIEQVCAGLRARLSG